MWELWKKKENRNFIVSQNTAIIGASSSAIILIYIIIKHIKSTN
jgi:hypothetical protein